MSREPLNIELKPTSTRVAAALREELLDGLHAPGTPLRDVELAARASVSRPTVREALAELARDGLVVHALNRGMEVARLDPADVRDIYAARRVIEHAGVVALTSARQRPVEPLAAAVAAMATAEASADRGATVQADVDFHAAIVAAAGARRLERAHSAAMLELRLVLSVTDRAYDEFSQAQDHERLLALLRTGTADEAGRELERHLSDAEARVCRVLERQP